jgi:hypothetical protein
MATALTETAAEQLRHGFADICREIGVDPAHGRLIKYTMNAVFVLDSYVLRLARGELALERGRRVAAAASALEAVGVPTVRLAGEVPVQPVHVDKWVATVWRRVAVVDVEPKPVDLAEPLSAIHSVDQLPVGLPAWAPIAKFRQRLAAAASLPQAEAADLEVWSQTELGQSPDDLLAFLSQRCDQVDAQLNEVKWHLPWGVIHADAHTGNVLLTAYPQRPYAAPGTVLCDLDGLCHGPREWDLVPTAHGPARFGRSAADYEAFANKYGFDVTRWAGWPVLQDVRELQLVTSVIDGIAGRPDVAAQLAHRLRSLLTDDRSTIWARFR